MKKFMYRIILTLCAAYLTGCSTEAKVTPGNSTFPMSTETPAETTAPEITEPETETTTAPPETTAAAKEVSVSMETLIRNETLHITYPRLSGLKDSAAEKQWNDRFQSEAQAAAERFADGTVFSGTWEMVSGSARIISLVHHTETTAPDAKDPVRSLVTCNIDSVTGRAVTLPTLCDTNSIAADLAAVTDAENTAYTITNPDGTDVTSEITMEALVRLHSKFTSGPNSKDIKTALVRLLNHMDYDGDNEVSGYSYWKDGNLHLIFSYESAAYDYIDILVKDAHRTISTK